jgi:DNA-binding CsgD family transcriptional regulator
LAAAARAQPLIVAVDDLQWLDRASVRALGFAVRRVSSEPIGLLATVRTERVRAARELTELLHDRNVERLSVGPLSVGAIERLLADRLNLTLPRTILVRLHETALGNPFFALELGRALVDADSLPGPGEALPVPGDLRELLMQRARELPRSAREALLLAALLAHASENTLAQAFGDGWDRALNRGWRAGIIAADGGMVRFAHPLLAAAVIGIASDRERRDAHRRLADAVDDEESRVRHLALAATGPDESVAAALEEAARGASRRGAPDAAAELAELARALTPVGRAHDVCRRYTIAGEARFSAGDSERAVELLSDAEIAAAHGPERAGVLWRLARVRYHHDNIAASRELLQEADREAGDDLALRAAIERDLSYPAFAVADVHSMLRHAEAASELAEQVDAADVLADSLGLAAVAEFLLGHGLRLDLMDRARDLEDWEQPRPVVLRPTTAAAAILAWADRVDEARGLLLKGERELTERGDDGALPFLWHQLAELDCWSGEWERGLKRALDADRLAVQTGQQGIRTFTCCAAAVLSAHLGRIDEATSYVTQGVTVAMTTGHALGAGLNMAVLGFVELSLGRADRAAARFGPVIATARPGGFEEPAAAWWMAEAIEALVVVGEHEQAADLTDWLEERARAIDRPTGLASAARCRALLAPRASPDEALALCDEALAHHDRVRAPFSRGRTLFVKGQIARRARKWGTARTELREALHVFQHLGAALWVDRARDELSRIGGRATSESELTQSERRIAELVATGRSNREVAEMLFLSPRTVSTSLARVFRKLDVTSRTEMAAKLDRTGSQSEGTG